MKIHPNLRTNRPAESFEETRFFKDENYYKGFDWYNCNYLILNILIKPLNYLNRYIEWFDYPRVNGLYKNFDKCSDYFDDPKVPKRIRNLIMNPQLVLFLMNPVDRAYLCYQVGRNYI